MDSNKDDFSESDEALSSEIEKDEQQERRHKKEGKKLPRLSELINETKSTNKKVEVQQIQK